MTSAGVCVMFTDETSDATVTNGRAETIALNSDVLCGNGGISNKTATSDVPVCDPEVCYMSAIVNLPGIIGLLIIGTHCSRRSTLHAFYVGQTGIEMPFGSRLVWVQGSMYCMGVQLLPCLQCFDAVGWAAGRTSGL